MTLTEIRHRHNIQLRLRDIATGLLIGALMPWLVVAAASLIQFFGSML